MVLACAAQAVAEVPETVAGKVFLDANNNGVLDPGEKMLAGVRVTDGNNPYHAPLVKVEACKIESCAGYPHIGV